jgi:hypothetical protein
MFVLGFGTAMIPVAAIVAPPTINTSRSARVACRFDALGTVQLIRRAA